MQQYILTYMRAWGFAEQDVPLCERCGGKAADVHHITYRSHGGTDEFENLIGLCRRCHDQAHALGSGSETVGLWKKWPNR